MQDKGCCSACDKKPVAKCPVATDAAATTAPVTTATTITVDQQLVNAVKDLEQELKGAGCDVNANQTICKDIQTKLDAANQSLASKAHVITSLPFFQNGAGGSRLNTSRIQH